MASIVLFEDAGFVNFLPLVYWRAVVALRCGRKSLLDHAVFRLRQPVAGVWTRSELADVTALRMQTPTNAAITDGTVLVNARWLLSGPVEFQKPPFVATSGDSIAYIACDKSLAERLSPELMQDDAACRRLIQENPGEPVDAEFLSYPWDLIRRNDDVLRDHWTGDDRGIEGKVSSAAHLVDPNQIHVGERTEIKPTAYINAEDGPVFISNDVLIEAHAYIEGPVYIGAGCVIKPHTMIRAGTTLGSLCKVAGEVSRTIIAGYSNKQHEGFLGDAYIGSWVNLGAGTTNSNLKNTYGPIRAQIGQNAVDTGGQFFGCTIGDFVRLGIGQLIPTGACIGFGAMVATGGFAPKYVPSFAWQTAAGTQHADVERLIATSRSMMSRRKVVMSPAEETLYRRIEALASQFGV